MRTKATMTAALAILFIALAAQAMMVNIPLPIVVSQSDLIVIGEVVQADGPQQLKIQIPDRAKPAHAWWRKYKIRITKVLRDTEKAFAVKDGKEAAVQIGVFTQARAPRAAGGPIRPMVCGPSHLVLKTGQKYLLLLRKLPGKAEYFLPSYPKNAKAIDQTEFNKKFVAKVEKLVDIDTWPWGKAAGGLQMALITENSQATLAQMRVKRGGPLVVRARVPLTIAMRNVSDRPITVNMYQWDRFLGLSYTQGKKQIEYPLYEYLDLSKRPQPAFSFAGKLVKTIKPGEIIFLGPNGASLYPGMRVSVMGEPGKMWLQAKYVSTRTAADPKDENRKLWTGEILSAPVLVELVKSGATGRLLRSR